MRLKNDELVALNLTFYGSNLNTQSLSQNTQLEVLPSAPKDSSLFIHNTQLYAVAANSLLAFESNECSDGSFQLYKLDSTNMVWTPVLPPSYSGVDDTSFYQDASIFVAPDSSSVYIYGGRCSSGSITNRLVSLNMDTMTFYNVTTPTRPQPFYGAVSLWAPNPQSLVIIGGKSSLGWLNMYQLATWSFQSGWLFQEAGQNGQSTVGSRTSPLVLPIFSKSTATNTQLFLASYSPSAALVIGGDSDTPLQAEWAKILFGNQKWAWSTLLPSLDVLNLMGGFVIFDTFVAVNSTSKRDSPYSLSLYDLSDNFRLIPDLKSSQAMQTKSTGSGSSKTVKILIGVLVPLVLIAIIASVAMYFWRRKVNRIENESILEALEYQFGHFRNALDQPYSILGHRPLDLYANNHSDSASTLDDNSIDLWVRKRQEYEASRSRAPVRHSYLASNETLTSLSEYSTGEDLHNEKTHSEHRISHEHSHESPLLQSPTSLPVHFLESHKRPLHESSPHPARLAQLKTHSFTMTPPGLPMIKKKSMLDPGTVPLEEPTDCESIVTNMDVQVLVSSKRKSILRVVNPDQEESETIRQRQPS